MDLSARQSPLILMTTGKRGEFHHCVYRGVELGGLCGGTGPPIIF